VLGSPDRFGAVYRLYSEATEANKLTRTVEEYLDSVVDVARHRRPGAVSELQGEVDAPILEMARSATGFRGERAEQSWYRFVRAGADPDTAVERLYLNVVSDRATAMLGAVVRDVVDSEDAFPGVLMAKLVPVRKVGQRSDAIVIFLKDAAATERVLAKIREYHAVRPEWFMRETPHVTERVLDGVSRAVNLPGKMAPSFGTRRANAIKAALERSVNGSRQDFEREVTAELQKRGVDVKRPHLDLPRGR